MTPALRRRLFFGALYFSEGAPIGWLWWALQSSHGYAVALASLAAVSLVALPLVRVGRVPEQEPT